uniref:Matrix metalloproteinase n=1 Tax=Pinctada fucata TaxID=50426 RepID=A0A2Z6G1C1_PINFU|nr:matrix metalloproteinase [Pinctada fucata]
MKRYITLIALFSLIVSVWCAVETLLDCDRYLYKYGYLRGTFDPDSGQEAPLHERTYALKYFQHFSNIPITGEFDRATMIKMNQKRCACEDVMTKETMMNTSLSFAPQQFNLGPKWSKTDLTWRLNGYSRKLRDNEVIRSELTRAFRVWSDVTPLTFREVTDRNVKVDIDMSFHLGEHGDGRFNAFDYRGGVLAHAFFPANGDTHFDDDENWQIQNDEGTEFFTVAAHEIGHALGLAHSTEEKALMAPYYAGYDPNFRLHYDDIRGIQTLYGGTTRDPFTQRPVPLTTMRPVRTPRPTLRPTPRPTPRQTQTPRPTPRQTPRPPRTERPVVTPSTREECNIKVRAAVTDFDGTLLLFTNGTTIYQVDLNRRYSPIKSDQSTKFSNPKRNPDAVYRLLNMGMTFIMKGQMIWQFDRMGNQMKRIFVQGGGYSLPERPRAVIAPTDNEIWIIMSHIVCRMTPRGEVIRGSHAYFSRTYRGVPYPVDAAVALKNDETIYFFKDQRFYEYSTRRRGVIRNGDIGREFFSCS